MLKNPFGIQSLLTIIVGEGKYAMGQNKRSPIALLFLLGTLAMAGCSSQCLLMRSEYYDVTGRAFSPKTQDQDILILREKPAQAFTKTGVVKVEAPWGTKDDAIEAEMKRRAREAGADALIDFTREEKRDNKVVFCGKVFDTKRSITAKAAAIVYSK